MGEPVDDRPDSEFGRLEADKNVDSGREQVLNLKLWSPKLARTLSTQYRRYAFTASDQGLGTFPMFSG